MCPCFTGDLELSDEKPEMSLDLTPIADPIDSVYIRIFPSMPLMSHIHKRNDYCNQLLFKCLLTAFISFPLAPIVGGFLFVLALV